MRVFVTVRCLLSIMWPASGPSNTCISHVSCLSVPDLSVPVTDRLSVDVHRCRDSLRRRV